MILEFQIENFGPIKERQTLSFEATKDTTLEDYYCVEVSPGVRILKLGILYGPNASGKSTILNALAFLKDLITKPLNQKTDILEYEPFLFEDFEKPKNTFFKLSFFINSLRYSYEVIFNKHIIVSEKLSFSPNGRMAEIFTRTTDEGELVSKIKFGSVKYEEKELGTKKSFNNLESNTISNITVLGAFSKSNVNIPILKIIYSWFSINLMNNVESNTELTNWGLRNIDENSSLKLNTLKILKKADVQISDFIIEEGIVEEITDKETIKTIIESIPEKIPDNNSATIKITSTLKHPFFEHTIEKNGDFFQYKLPVSLESLGTRRYFGLSVILSYLFENQRVISIDEFDSSLHYELMKHFIMTFLANSTHSQMLVTTHNLSFLDDPDILRKDTIWFTEKQNDGATKLYSLSDFDTKTIRKGTSILNAYKIGKFGAIPNLGSIYLEKSTPENESK